MSWGSCIHPPWHNWKRWPCAPLQENFLRSEQLQLFLELRDTLDKLA